MQYQHRIEFLASQNGVKKGGVELGNDAMRVAKKHR